MQTVVDRERLLKLARAANLARKSLDVAPIIPGERGGRLALSFAQQRLWFLEQLGSAGRAYHIPKSLRLRGELHREALGRALDRIVERHEALRTTFHEVDGEPVQVIGEAGGFQLSEHDLGAHPQAEAELRRLMAEESGAPFDLARGPLIRGRLVRMADDDHALLVTMHHIVSDGWSMDVVVRELGALYGAFSRGEADPLPALPVQYADYSAWQRRWVNGEVLQKQVDYWRTTLAGAPELLELPADRPRPAQQDPAGAFAALELDEELTAGLKALAQRHGATLFMTMLAAWSVVLARLSGQDDVVIGTPTANRGRKEIEGLIGFFVNTLALRMDLSGAPTVAELLGRVKAAALGAQHHQDIPFEQVVEVVKPARSMAHTPLFQVMFSWQSTPAGALALPGLELAAAGAASHSTAKFDLSLALQESGGRITGGVTYAKALYDAATMERYLGYLRAVVAAMVADETQTVDRLPLLADAERWQVLEGWNATDAEYPSALCVHQLFEAQVERTPNAVAVACDGAEMTYAELNARANRLAHHLRSLGVGPDARVAVCSERTPELVAGLLAILKAGGAYVPLDPAYPDERLRHMVEDSAPIVLLAQASLAGRFSGVPVLDLGDDSVWAACPETNPAPAGLTPDHLAYLIYTSGSTGLPKGVMVRHQGLTHYIDWAKTAYADDQPASFALYSSFAFDLTVTSLYVPLVTGGAVVVYGERGEGDIAVLRVFEDDAVDVVKLTPAHLALLEGRDLSNRRIRKLIVGGEELKAPLARSIVEASAGEMAIFNEYGPTETVVGCMIHRFDPELDRGAAVPIGRPITNTRMYVLDASGEPVPMGVVGELYIGGAGVARGYLNRAELTAERFVEDRFSGVPGARLYRTGDLGRWLRDGTIEFLGRNDFQVKIRGFRIELGEIEARLCEVPGIREAVVLALGAGADTRLVAYYAAAEALEVETLRAHLLENLPEYMVPAAFVHLDAIPLTNNGKVDRKALPAPEGDAFATRGYEAPVGETEEALASIWTEVLGVERVGRKDHFFEMGGHSLRAVQVVARVRQVLGAEVALADVFTYPVLEALAGRIEGSLPEVRGDRAIAVRTTGSQRPLFLVHEGTGSVAYAQALRPHVDAEIPLYALPAVSVSELRLRTVEGMAARMVKMIREVQPEGPYRLAGWSFGGTVAYEIATQLIGQDQAVEFVGMMDTHYRAAETAGDDYALLLRMLRMEEGLGEVGGAALAGLAAAAATQDLETLVAKCHETGLLPAHVSADRVRQMRGRLRDHARAMREYFAQPIPAPVHVFPAQQGPAGDVRLGWQAVLGDNVRVTPVPGNHLTMMEAPNAEALGRALSREISRATRTPGAEDRYSPLVTLQFGKSGAAPLFCVPGAGASVVSFTGLAGCVDPSWPVHGLQSRGMEGEMVPHSSVRAAAEAYLRVVEATQPEGPVHLLGHSFGGWIVFEMARRLRSAGRVVGSLTIVDTSVPDEEGAHAEWESGEVFLQLVKIFEQTVERPLGIGPADAAALDEAGRMRLLHARLVQVGLMPQRSTPDVLRGPFRTFATCMRTLYTPDEAYPDPVRLVLVPDPELGHEENRRALADAVRGWRRWAPRLEFLEGAGNHMTALKPPHVAALAATLAADREGARRVYLPNLQLMGVEETSAAD